MALILLVCTIGCQQNNSIQGNVTYNGEPIEKGYISFRPTGGTGQSLAAPITDGRYTIEKSTPGKKTAVITGVKKVNFYASSAESYQKAEEARKAGALQADVAEAADYIAPDAEGNSKEVDIQPGAQTLDFAITGTPVPK
jgi:hypothetical protein